MQVLRDQYHNILFEDEEEVATAMFLIHEANIGNVHMDYPMVQEWLQASKLQRTLMNYTIAFIPKLQYAALQWYVAKSS